MSRFVFGPLLMGIWGISMLLFRDRWIRAYLRWGAGTEDVSPDQAKLLFTALGVGAAVMGFAVSAAEVFVK